VKFPASLGTFGSVIFLLRGLDSQLAGLDTSPDIFELHWWLLQVHSLHWLDLGTKAGQRGDPVYIAASLVFRIRVMAQLSAEARLIRQRATRATHAHGLFKPIVIQLSLRLMDCLVMGVILMFKAEVMT